MKGKRNEDTEKICMCILYRRSPICCGCRSTGQTHKTRGKRNATTVTISFDFSDCHNGEEGILLVNKELAKYKLTELEWKDGPGNSLITIYDRNKNITGYECLLGDGILVGKKARGGEEGYYWQVATHASDDLSLNKGNNFYNYWINQYPIRTMRSRITYSFEDEAVFTYIILWHPKI